MRLERFLLAALILVSCGDDKKPSEPPTPPEPQIQEVDLGLSVCWADRNAGAAETDSIGLYVAWGEVKAKDNYTLETYKYYVPLHGAYFLEYKPGDILGEEDDVASVLYGEGWRTPTKEEWQELVEKCTWTFDEGRSGYTVAGPGGGSIFLPAAGYRDKTGLDGAGTLGYYWSATLGSGMEENAWAFNFNGKQQILTYIDRCKGFQVRAVRAQ